MPKQKGRRTILLPIGSPKGLNKRREGCVRVGWKETGTGAVDGSKGV